MDLTKLEKQVLENILSSEFMDAQGEQVINWGVWSFSVTNETKELAGALGSTTKKGLTGVEQEPGEDSVCYLTRKGYEVAKELKLI